MAEEELSGLEEILVTLQVIQGGTNKAAHEADSCAVCICYYKLIREAWQCLLYKMSLSASFLTCGTDKSFKQRMRSIRS